MNHGRVEAVDLVHIVPGSGTHFVLSCSLVKYEEARNVSAHFGPLSFWPFRTRSSGLDSDFLEYIPHNKGARGQGSIPVTSVF